MITLLLHKANNYKFLVIYMINFDHYNLFSIHLSGRRSMHIFKIKIFLLMKVMRQQTKCYSIYQILMIYILKT